MRKFTEEEIETIKKGVFHIPKYKMRTLCIICNERSSDSRGENIFCNDFLDTRYCSKDCYKKSPYKKFDTEYARDFYED